MHCWTHNDISATTLQKLAHAALLDGNCHQEIAALAALGAFGSTPSHINRDLRRRHMKGIRLHPASVCTVPCIDPKGKSGITYESAGIIDPHNI
eukprot:14473374-Alexandrium_andersonii.AAC.1